MNAYTLYLGLKDKDGFNVAPRLLRVAYQDTAQTFGGYTATQAHGGYTDARGIFTTELATRIEVVTDKPVGAVHAWAERLRILTNQESILLTSVCLNSAEFRGAYNAPAPALEIAA